MMVEVKPKKTTNIPYPVFKTTQSVLNWKILMNHLYLYAVKGKQLSKPARVVVDREDFIDVQLEWFRKAYIMSITKHTFTRFKVSTAQKIISELDDIQLVRTAVSIVNKYSITDDIFTEYYKETIKKP